MEICKICEFVWFDAGETRTFSPRAITKKTAPLPQEAREAIAIAKVKALAEEARGPDFDSAAPDEWWKQIAAFFGLPVEFDAPESARRPVVTWFLTGIIVIVSVHAFFHLQEIVQLFGLIPVQATRMHGLTFVTSFFLHVGIIHLVGNMYFLFVFGDDVENFLRPAALYHIDRGGRFVGDLVHIVSNPASTILCVGASGGIAGLITFYALAFPQAKIAFLWRYFFIGFDGFVCRPGLFLCSGFSFRSSARTSRRSALALCRRSRIWRCWLSASYFGLRTGDRRWMDELEFTRRGGRARRNLRTPQEAGCNLADRLILCSPVHNERLSALLIAHGWIVSAREVAQIILIRTAR